MSAPPEFPQFGAYSSACPKCGGDQVSTKYHDRTCDRSRSACHWNDLTDRLCCTYEHLDRTCQRCHFSWPEAVLEAGGAPS